MDHSISRTIIAPSNIAIPVNENGVILPCAHEHGKTLRWYTQSNHVRVMAYQCLRCGRRLNNVPKKSVPEQTWSTIPEWDTTLESTYRDATQYAREILSAEWNRQVNAEQDAWWRQYEAYLRTPHWQRRRAARLKMDRHVCQAQLPCCTGPASEVHHLTYQHLGNEPLFDLVSVCTACHQQITTMKREGRS